MPRPALLAVALVVALAGRASAAPPPPASGKVVSVHDGDTLTVRTDGGETLKVRLHGIDAPELGQPWGRRSRESLAELAQGKVVEVLPVDRDRYGRIVARVRAGGEELNREQVARGLAWRYDRYDRANDYGRAQEAARGRRSGLWGDPAPVAPWEWRAGEAARRKAKAAAKR